MFLVLLFGIFVNGYRYNVKYILFYEELFVLESKGVNCFGV